MEQAGFEAATTASGIPVVWLEQHNLPTGGSVDHTRLYGSPYTVWEEWRAGTDPFFYRVSVE